jgi:hypothetical protein
LSECHLGQRGVERIIDVEALDGNELTESCGPLSWSYGNDDWGIAIQRLRLLSREEQEAQRAGQEQERFFSIGLADHEGVLVFVQLKNPDAFGRPGSVVVSVVFASGWQRTQIATPHVDGNSLHRRQLSGASYVTCVN